MNTHLRILTEDVLRDLLAKIASEESQKVIKAAQAGSEESGRFKMLITTQDVDRDNEVVLASAWDTENYMKNPVVLLFHDMRQLPVAVTEKLTRTDKGLEAEGFFAPADANPVAQQVRKLYELGIMRAASVGFMVRERDRANPNVISKAELYEWSFVPVPANPNALSLLAENGFDVKELVSKGFLMEAKSEVEIKTTEPVETKGQIEDTLEASAEMRQAKYSNMWPFWTEIYKFYDAYYSDMTSPEDFAKLIGELTVNLSTLKPAETMDDEEMKSFISKMEASFAGEKKEEKAEEEKTVDTEEKAGRTISKKTRAILKAAHDATSQACDTLSKLLEVADGAEGSDEESDEEKAIEPTVLAELETLRQREAETKALIRSIATACNVGLSKKK